MAFYSTNQFAHVGLAVHPSPQAPFSQASSSSSSSSSSLFSAQPVSPSSSSLTTSIPNTTNFPTSASTPASGYGSGGLPHASTLANANANASTVPPYATSTPVPRVSVTSPSLTLPPRGPFAYHHRPLHRNSDNGWRFADLRTEYTRLGLMNSPMEWRVFDNSTWSLCDTYPSLLVLPTAFSDQDIWTASAHRSKQRLPVVTYRHDNRRVTSTTSSSSSPSSSSSSSSSASPSSSSDSAQTNSSNNNFQGEDPSSPVVGAADKGLGLCPVLTRSAQPMVRGAYYDTNIPTYQHTETTHRHNILYITHPTYPSFLCPLLTVIMHHY